MQMSLRGIRVEHEPGDQRPIGRDPVPSYSLHNRDNLGPIHRWTLTDVTELHAQNHS